MKKYLLGLSGLALGALLAGCTSTPAAPVVTVEDQAKLIEYDNCIRIFTSARGAPQFYWEEILKDCAQYRP